MNGLPMGAPSAPAQQAAGQDPIDVSSMDIPALLMEKLNLDEAGLEQLFEALQSAQSGAEAAQIIKAFDQNPETMNEPFQPEAPAQAAPAPAQAGLPMAK